MSTSPIKLIECPRDAMQGLHDFIPTETKVNYINQLLKVGFDTIDFGSFVSAKAIPQLRDTTEVLSGLDLSSTKSKLLAIVANTRGAEDAVKFKEIDYLGFPFSISETFQQRNTNSSIEESLTRVAEIQKLCKESNKKLVVYISMAFGNPYGDEWNLQVAANWCKKLYENLGIDILALSDTIGVSNPDNIKQLFGGLIPELPNVEFGAHLHSTPNTVFEKVEAAYQAGCRRFDGAIKGFGGCPMATDDLTGNMPTEEMISYFNSQNLGINIDNSEFQKSMMMALNVFPNK
jgi:hydroxymethylglutaryl-CoA lyase